MGVLLIFISIQFFSSMENDRVFKTLLINLNICYLNIKFVTNKTILMKITNDYILLRSEINNLFRLGLNEFPN